jgi:hypothetical protein
MRPLVEGGSDEEGGVEAYRSMLGCSEAPGLESQGEHRVSKHVSPS